MAGASLKDVGRIEITTAIDNFNNFIEMLAFDDMRNAPGVPC